MFYNAGACVLEVLVKRKRGGDKKMSPLSSQTNSRRSCRVDSYFRLLTS